MWVKKKAHLKKDIAKNMERKETENPRQPSRCHGLESFIALTCLQKGRSMTVQFLRKWLHSFYFIRTIFIRTLRLRFAPKFKKMYGLK